MRENHDIRVEDRPKLFDIINKIEEEPKSYEFREPVKWKELGLMNYLQIIKRPMDLKTLRVKYLSNRL